MPLVSNFCFCYGGALAEGTPALSKEGTQLKALPTAAAVFDVGRLVQSPIPNTFGYRLCCRVSLSTSTQPAASATGLILRTSGGPMGGVTWSISYCKKGEHPNVCLFHYFHSRTSSGPNSLTHTWTMAAQSTVQLVLILIHTLAKIIHAPMQGSDKITDVVSPYRVHGIPLAAGMGESEKLEWISLTFWKNSLMILLITEIKRWCISVAVFLTLGWWLVKSGCTRFTLQRGSQSA